MAKPIVTTRILRRLLSGGMRPRAERLIARMHPADLGPLLSDLTPEETRTVVDMLFRQRRAADALSGVPPELLPQVFEALEDQRVAAVLAQLELDDMLMLAEVLSEERRDPVLQLLPPEKREELRRAELYPEQSAGQAMTTSFVALDEKMTAQEAIDTVRAAGPEQADSILYLYVVDEFRRLLGIVPIRRLVAAPPDTRCSELMIRDPISVSVDADQEEAAHLVAHYDLLAIPVTDVDGTMLGVITVDDVIDVITEEATEDMYNLAGLSDEDRVFTSARVSIRKRLPWMILNLGTVFVAAWVVGRFERTIEQLVVLAAFLPVVAGMGGNGGVQTLTVITRGIALGEIEFSSGLRAVAKEMGVGLVLGAAVGGLSAGIAYLWHGDPMLSFVLWGAMVLTMAVAGLLGASVPLALKALKQDPALGAGVIVTTVTDTFGFLCFLGMATLLLDRFVT